MKVICAGMCKTGTKSMHVALGELGYSVHDYPDAFDYFGTEYAKFHDRGWTVSDFRVMYENIDSVVDGPVYYFWEELVEAFPEAKIVLTIRDDEEVWLRSFSNQVSLLNGIYLFLYSRLSPSYRRFIRFIANSAYLSFGGKRVTGFETNTNKFSDMKLKQAYRRHIAHVTNKCSKKRLLLFNCKNGWEPLCQFLDKPVPKLPFPKSNVGGEQAILFWELDVMKQAKREVRIKISIISIALALASFAIITKC